MHEKFCASSRAYVSAVKAALRSQTRQNAAEIFERAIDVLTIDGQTQEEEGGDGNELNSLKDRIAQIERQLQEAQNKSSFLESQLNSSMKKNVRLDAKIGNLKDTVVTFASETKDSIKELTEVSKENSANIQGLRKLQMLMKQRDQLTEVSKENSANIQGLRKLQMLMKQRDQRSDFTAKVTADKREPGIEDVQLLPGGRLLLADYGNMCVKLFDTQGQHLHTLECRSLPCRLAVLDSSSIRHTVAVTLPCCSGIDILEVNGDNMEVKNQWVVHSIFSPHLKEALVAP
ncbi:hypothetical protein PoB_005508900 [Plakobranchus ocellatus]|uniref:Uncharacterized protein n=1 Tax=Plakobranchus ocellatus TaxID=259542 RepID=A0AAV4CBV4_9GAST|nr:hypothetical protein PoB_005508900 [Plakobranchus ocellatus]